MSIRLDYLPNTDLSIYQDDEMFCINTDTEVLGQFIKIYRNDTVLDIGTNNGALLLYASRYNPKKMIGIDINSKAIDLAKKNMVLNNIENCSLINIDAEKYYGDEVDVIIFNPPYFSTNDDNKSCNEYLNIAKHEGSFCLDKMVDCIFRNLKNNGTVYFLFQTSRLSQVILAFEKKHLAIKEMQFVYDINKEYSNVFMIRAVKNAKKGMVIKKPIIIDRK